MKALENKPDSNRDQIQLYLVSEEGTVPLTDKQKELLDRWSYADELIRQKEIRTREVQATMIIKKYGVSRATAYQDIVNAEAVFASSTPLNKRYRIQSRIEFIEQKIDELYGNVRPFDPDDPEEMEHPDAKMYRMEENEEYINQAIALEKVLQKYYDAYPDIIPPRSPKKIVYNLQVNNLPAAPMTREEAINKARQIIQIKPREDGSGS